MGRGSRRARRLTLAPGWSPGRWKTEGEYEVSAFDGEGYDAGQCGSDVEFSCDPSSAGAPISASWGRFWVLSAEDSVEEDSVGGDDGVVVLRGCSSVSLNQVSPQTEGISTASSSGSCSPFQDELARSSSSTETPRTSCKRSTVSSASDPGAWHGPLPSPRQSPAFTFGDALQKAVVRQPRASVRKAQGRRARTWPAMACPKHRDALPEESGNTISHEVPSVRGPNLNVREAEKSRPGTSGQTVGLASKGSGGNWLGIQRGKPYEPPPGLVAFFQNSHSPFPLRRAPRTQHRRLGFSSYAASVRAQPSVLMEKQGAQSNQQGDRAPVPNSGRAADRGNFQYEGPNQFRQGQAGAQHQHRGRSWARPGYGRGGFRGSFRGRGDFRQNHEGGGASAAKSNAANCGLAPAQTEIATAFDQSAKAETLDQSAKAEAILQKALAAIQELKKEPMPSNGVVQNAGGDAKASSNQQWQVSGEMSKHVKEAAQEEGVKNSTKAHCHRCYGKGHTMNDCVAKLYCYVCDTDTHIKQRCPVYNAPKVYALPVGYGVNKGGFFHVPTNKKLAKMGDAKVAIIQVSDGEISAANVVCELERLLPNFAPWKVDQVDTKTFRTLFPSASELSRMVEWGPVRAKSQKATLEFRPASSGGRVKATLVDVWVQFNGLPSEFCTVPHIWGVGSTLGVASEVDMAFYRKHGICRVQVGVIDPQAIPFAGDVEIAKVIYEVHFWVEDGSSEGLPLAVDEEGSLDDDQNNNDKEHKGSDGKEGDGINKAANAKVANVNKQGGGGSLGHKHNLDGTKQVQVQCAHDITTAAGTSLIADAGDGPMLGDDHMSPIAVTRKELTVEGGLEVLDQMPKGDADRMKQMAAIPEAEQTSVAGRKRRTSTTDEHSLARAERLKAERNGGNPIADPILSSDNIFDIPFGSVVSNLEGIGISLGKENEEIIRSVQSMKNFEKTIADQSKNGNNIEGLVFDLEEDESDEELDKIILYNLCGGIVEETMDGGIDDVVCCQDLGQPSTIKKKKKFKRKKKA